MKNLLFILFAFAILLCSCKKYKEGPAISLRTKTNRITGTWKIERLYINDIDSTNEYQTKLEYKIKLSKDNNAQLISCNDDKVLNGSWEFCKSDMVSNSKENAISIKLPKDTSFFIIGTGNIYILTGVGEIRRLTNQELKIEYLFFENNNYSLKKIILELKKE